MGKQMMRLLLLPALFLLAACDAAVNELETDETATERSYTKTIEREGTSAFEASLIAQAEAAYPPRDSVLAAVLPEQHGQIPETGYWYYSSFDGVLIPYAITGDAVTYYSALIDSLERETSAFFTQAELEYKADVSFEEAYAAPSPEGVASPQESFERVYVVSMSLKWFQYCGSLCAMWIDQQRVVVFDASGTLLRVFLDGPTSVLVS